MRFIFMATKTFAVMLIATTAIFAKAEPSVYFCNTTEFAQVTDDGVGNIKSYPFRLFVDLDQKKIKISGDIAIAPLETLHDGQDNHVMPWTISSDKGEDAFFAFNSSILLDFQNGQLAATKLAYRSVKPGFLLSSLLASCEKF